MPFNFILWRKKTDQRTVCCFSTCICTGVDEAGGVSCPVSVFLLGHSLNEQLPSLPAMSLYQTPVSSCEKAQFCLSLPKRKHIMKCKPVAPPEKTGLLSDCSLSTNSQKHRAPKSNKKKKSGWMEMFARHYCCMHIA